MRKYSVVLSQTALRQLKKMDRTVQRLILSWMAKNLEGTADPRLHGKALRGSLGSYWRYRVGDYRIIAEIRDSELLIVAVSVAHRSEVYK